MAIQFVSVMAIARILSPEEIGIFSISVAFIALAQTLREFGLGAYLIQERDLDRGRMRSAFGVALVLAWAVAALIAVASGPVANFYGQAGIQDVLLILALTFFVSPIGLPAQAILVRELQFGKLYLVQLISSIFQVVMTIALALLGFSYLSMALASLGGGLAGVAFLAAIRPNLVFILPSLDGWRRIAAFGSLASGANLVGSIGVNMADLINGRMLSRSELAHYSRANGLLNMFRSSIQAAVMSVAMPAFASQYRAGIDMRPDYGRATALMTVLAWPFYALLALLAHPIIRVLYGPQWDPAVPVTQILCLGGAVTALTVLAGPLMFSIGQVRANLNREIAIQAPRAVLTLAASLHSLEAVAASQVAAYLIALCVTQSAISGLIGFGSAELVRATWRSFAVTVASVAVAAAVALLPDPDAGSAIPWHSLVLPSLGGACGWLAAVYLFDHPIRHEIRVALTGIAARLRIASA